MLFIGDNLGSHYIGGFTENFSTSRLLLQILFARQAFHVLIYTL